MPFPFVPALMAGKMALDLIGGYQARRDARKQNERMNAQNAMGGFLAAFRRVPSVALLVRRKSRFQIWHSSWVAQRIRCCRYL